MRAESDGDAMKVRQGEPMVDPCVDCGRAGARYGSHGMCTTCTVRQWRAVNPEKAREQSRRWKDRNRERNRARDRDRARAGRRGPAERATPSELIRCVECGEQMLERSPSGACGFCAEERAA